MIWARRNGSVGGGRGNLGRSIDESRIYGIALTEKEIKSLELGSLSVQADDKLATKWAVIKGK